MGPPNVESMTLLFIIILRNKTDWEASGAYWGKQKQTNKNVQEKTAQMQCTDDPPLAEVSRRKQEVLHRVVVPLYRARGTRKWIGGGTTI